MHPVITFPSPGVLQNLVTSALHTISNHIMFLGLDHILLPLFQFGGPNLSSGLLIRWKSTKNASKTEQNSSPSGYFAFSGCFLSCQIEGITDNTHTDSRAQT